VLWGLRSILQDDKPTGRIAKFKMAKTGTNVAVWAALAGNSSIAGVCSANSIVTVQLAPNNVIATLSLDFFDYLRAPDIERAVIELEARVRSAHPEVSALFVKPQSVLVAAERAGEGSGGLIPDGVGDDAGSGAITSEEIGDG
jgi:hypothetical protein